MVYGSPLIMLVDDTRSTICGQIESGKLDSDSLLFANTLDRLLGGIKEGRLDLRTVVEDLSQLSAPFSEEQAGIFASPPIG